MERTMNCPRCQRVVVYKSFAHYMEIVDQYLRSHGLQRDMLWPFDYEKEWEEHVLASHAAKKSIAQTKLMRGDIKWRGK